MFCTSHYACLLEGVIHEGLCLPWDSRQVGRDALFASVCDACGCPSFPPNQLGYNVLGWQLGKVTLEWCISGWRATNYPVADHKEQLNFN